MTFSLFPSMRVSSFPDLPAAPGPDPGSGCAATILPRPRERRSLCLRRDRRESPSQNQKIMDESARLWGESTGIAFCPCSGPGVANRSDSRFHGPGRESEVGNCQLLSLPTWAARQNMVLAFINHINSLHSRMDLVFILAGNRPRGPSLIDRRCGSSGRKGGVPRSARSRERQ
jgi:hypothetical protein